MKKFLCICLAIGFGLCVFAQQNQFEGNEFSKHSLKYEENFDIVLENAKKAIDANDQIAAADKALYKMFLKPMVKATLERMDLEKYLTDLPDGNYTVYGKIKGNSCIAFCPELGRVIVRFPSEGYDYIIFPKLQLGCKIEYTPTKQIEEIYSPIHVMDTKGKVVQINGIPCIPNYTLIEYEKVGGELVDTLTYNGVLYVMLPVPGYVHAEYQKMGIQTTTSNEYVTRSDEILKLEPQTVNNANFTIPEKYEIVDNKKFVKKVKKIIKDDPAALSIPFNGTLPDIIWDCVNVDPL